MALTKVKGSILSDELYRRENNLSDVLDKAAGRTNLDVYSKAESDSSSVMPGKNLLINGDFSVWQRGESFIGESDYYSGFTADRWCVENFDVRKKPDNGFNLSAPEYGGFYQVVESVPYLKGKKVTLSYLEEELSYDGTKKFVYMRCRFKNKSGDFVGVEQKTDLVNYPPDDVGSLKAFRATVTMDSPVDAEHLRLEVMYEDDSGSGSVEFTIRNIKLEEGDKPTPFVPDDIGINLIKCQRYYQLIRVGLKAQGSAEFSYLSSTVTYPVPMRADPTAVYGDARYSKDIRTVSTYYVASTAFTWQAEIMGGDPTLYEQQVVLNAEF